MEAWFSTPPLNPLRVVALNHFWESQLLTELLGISPANLSDFDMDKHLNSLLSFLEPESIESTGTPGSE